MANPQPVVLILGGAKRIGEQCAHRFIENGWSAFVADTDAKALKTISDDLGDKVGTLKSDCTKSIGLDNILSGVTDKFGSIDSVCHIPDIPEPADLFSMSSTQFNETVVAPARSITMAMQRISKRMLQQLDDMEPSEAKVKTYAFTQVFGMGAQLFDPGRYSQNAAQSMAMAASKAAALDLAQYHIRSNSILAIRPRAENEEPWLKQRTPLGRHSYADEIADAIFYLSSSSASNMTGQTITLDGGRSLLNGQYSREEY